MNFYSGLLMPKNMEKGGSQNKNILKHQTIIAFGI
jgi:hypothetical protein